MLNGKNVESELVKLLETQLPSTYWEDEKSHSFPGKVSRYQVRIDSEVYDDFWPEYRRFNVSVDITAANYEELQPMIELLAMAIPAKGLSSGNGDGFCLFIKKRQSTISTGTELSAGRMELQVSAFVIAMKNSLCGFCKTPCTWKKE